MKKKVYRLLKAEKTKPIEVKKEKKTKKVK